MNSKFFSARNVALLGILIALVIVFQLFASAIRMFGVTLNFSLIPIALAGILLGTLGGAIVGFSCGLVVFITMAVLGQEPSTAMCIGKTTAAGAVCGLVFKLLKKYGLHLAVSVSSVVIPVINTGIYMLGIVIMKDAAAEFMQLGSSSASTVFAVVFGLIWLNFVLEIAINCIFTPLLYRVIKVIDKN